MKELLEGLNTQQEMQLYLQVGRYLIETIAYADKMDRSIIDLRVMKSEIGRKREKILANPPEIVAATLEGEEVTP